MTKEFGIVLSVRTFTRHVSERPTGYGFVLFQSVDSAQRCIETLRKYRNLHPSLSKQVHKIPGTPYAKVQTPEVNTPSKKDSFKARMEQFKDEGSTNLYIEGLPLTIDEPTLAARNETQTGRSAPLSIEWLGSHWLPTASS
jgi:RNA recognition motif-containing protein